MLAIGLCIKLVNSAEDCSLMGDIK